MFLSHQSNSFGLLLSSRFSFYPFAEGSGNALESHEKNECKMDWVQAAQVACNIAFLAAVFPKTPQLKSYASEL